jgi:hypothetical protein
MFTLLNRLILILLRHIIKPRIRRRTWRTIEELKAMLQEEWDKVTMEEIRALMTKTGGLPIKSDLL